MSIYMLNIIGKLDTREAYWDAKISFSCILYYILSVLNSTIKIVLPDSSINTILSPLCGAGIILGLLLCLKEVYKRNSKLFVSSVLLFILIYVVSLLLIVLRGEPIDLIFKGNILVTFCWWLPLGIYSASIIDKSIMYNVFLRGSYVVLALLIIMFLFHPLTIYETSGYNMFFGFNLIIPTLFHLNELFKTKGIKYFVLVIIEFAMLLAYANRGCWIGILFFILFKLIKSKTSTKILFCIIVLPLVTMILSSSSLGLAIENLLESFGITSRSLEMLLSGTFANDSANREHLWENGLQMIFDSPILGWGLGGEYYRMAQLEGSITADTTFTPHNGVIQNMVNFGILGGLIVTLLLLRPYFNLSRIKEQSHHDLVLIFGSSITASFLSSGSFFTMPATAIFLYMYYFRKFKR